MGTQSLGPSWDAAASLAECLLLPDRDPVTADDPPGILILFAFRPSPACPRPSLSWGTGPSSLGSAVSAGEQEEGKWNALLCNVCRPPAGVRGAGGLGTLVPDGPISWELSHVGTWLPSRRVRGCRKGARPQPRRRPPSPPARLCPGSGLPFSVLSPAFAILCLFSPKAAGGRAAGGGGGEEGAWD